MRTSIVTLAVCTLAFAACGDDDETPDTGDDTVLTTDDDSESTTDDGEESQTSSAEEMLDTVRQQLLDLGLNEEQADCVLDKSMELGMEGGGTPSNEELLGVYEECDVDLAELQPGS